jgi:hypothetical protein
VWIAYPKTGDQLKRLPLATTIRNRIKSGESANYLTNFVCALAAVVASAVPLTSQVNQGVLIDSIHAVSTHPFSWETRWQILVFAVLMTKTYLH